MILAPPQVFGVAEDRAANPATDPIRLLYILGTTVVGPKLGVMRQDVPNLQLLLSLLNRGGSRSGRLDDRSQFLFLRGQGGLEVEVGLDGIGLGGELPQFGGLLFVAIFGIGKFAHASGNGCGTVLQLLKVLAHFG